MSIPDMRLQLGIIHEDWVSRQLSAALSAADPVPSWHVFRYNWRTPEVETLLIKALYDDRHWIEYKLKPGLRFKFQQEHGNDWLPRVADDIVKMFTAVSEAKEANK